VAGEWLAKRIKKESAGNGKLEKCVVFGVNWETLLAKPAEF
jgi:hypothetical protein